MDTALSNVGNSLLTDRLQGAWTDLPTAQLLEEALRNGEGVLAANGALTVNTGKRTGRSPKDRYIVSDANTESQVHWGPVNQPISTERFDALWERAVDYLADRRTYVIV